MSLRPRHSVLYMPGSNARAIAKARTLPVDGIIFDLEDAVAPDAKPAARKQVIDAIKTGGFGKRELLVRVNGIDTPWFADDAAAALQAGPDAILVPKISTPKQIEMIGQRFLDMHADARVHLWAMIETPLAIFNAAVLAAEARDSETRLAGFVIGTNDLARESRARIVPGRAPMLPWLSECVLAAHAYAGAVIGSSQNDRVRALAFISALAPDEGETVAEVFYREPPLPEAPQLAPDAHGFIWMPDEGFPSAFAQDASKEEIGLFTAVQRPIHVACIQEKAPKQLWKSVPSWYLLARRDRMINPKTQEFMAARMKAEVHRFDVDHTPIATAPDKVVEVILAALTAA